MVNISVISLPLKRFVSVWKACHFFLDGQSNVWNAVENKCYTKIILKAELFRNSGMKYRKKITYLGILCKNFHVWYDSERNTRILSWQVFEYTLRSFSDFSVIGWGMTRRDVIIYKVDRVLHYNERKCTISICVLLQMFKNRFQCVLKLSNVKSKRSHITDVQPYGYLDKNNK